MTSLAPCVSDSVARAVEAFEAACAANPETSLDDFVLPADLPGRIRILVELIRVDLERAWRGGRPRSLEHYRTRFPDAFQPEFVPDLAYEEYRHRRFAGETVIPEYYRNRFGIDVSQWELIPAGSLAVRYKPRTEVAKQQETIVNKRRKGPLSQSDLHIDTPVPPSEATQAVRRPASAPELVLSDSVKRSVRRLRQSDPKAADKLVASQKEFPAVGTEFLGFQLLEELGRGAFGRVFLARQSDLSGRPVALKLACDVVSESRSLAQLQHTNIMPVYSYHRANTLQAVCMPFLGRVTFADLLRSYRTDNRLPDTGRQLRSIVAETSMRRSSPDLMIGDPSPVPITIGNDWVKLEHWDYVRSIIWFGAQLAEGLAHAHSRGILHRDLKPANVLLTDDGRPMILDFNMAEDVKGRNVMTQAVIGGTIRYMSPEQIRIYTGEDLTLDGRSDVFSLGAILFELLSGQLPYEISDPDTDPELKQMLLERMKTPPSLRALNPIVPWGVDAILRKCLAPDRNDRYESALALREDLERELADRPLRYVAALPLKERSRKWFRRNPFAASAGFIVLVAAILISAGFTGWWFSRDRARTLEARETFAAHRREFRQAQITADDRNRSEGMDAAASLRALLDRYELNAESNPEEWTNRRDVSRLAESDRQQLRDDLGETFYLLANRSLEQARTAAPGERDLLLAEGERWNRAARNWGERIPHAVDAQQRTLTAMQRNDAATTHRITLPANPAELSARDLYLVSYGLVREGRFAEALPGLRLATQKDPENISAWFVRGQVHGELQQPEMAAQCYGACISLRPEFAPAWLNRGLAYAQMRFFDDAMHDYDRALRLRPQWAEAYLQRATVASLQGRPADAERDLTSALDCGFPTPRLFFLRASVRDRLGNPRGAASDREYGLLLTPTDELSWIARGEQRLVSDPAGALSDVERALALNPRSAPAFQLQAHVLSERLNRPEESLAVLDRAISLYPESAVFRAGRGVLLARRGKVEAARADARHALLLDGKAPNLYQVACIFALTSTQHREDGTEALRLLRISLQSGFGLDFIDSDPDLNPLRERVEFQQILAAAQSLHQKGTR